ncbi:hypothetical protein ACG83_22545 [Frankia sp. R43]|nr:hypothetical protein ACG83_22545 [Frankia sp. R43]
MDRWLRSAAEDAHRAAGTSGEFDNRPASVWRVIDFAPDVPAVLPAAVLAQAAERHALWCEVRPGCRRLSGPVEHRSHGGPAR